MQCPRCQHDNPAGGVFCEECGSRLEAACPACGWANQLSAKFCTKCGSRVRATPTFGSPQTYTPRHLAENILTSRSALEGERKQVTVLFVDLIGFTSLSERLDPEDVHGLMTRVFELMLAEVHRYEGTVNQFLGDGIMALFGAPIAHEDHARRAVHAALGIRQALEGDQEELRARRGIALRLRQGLNTGLVVVGSIGNDLRMDYTAIGDTTNVAARLQQAAEPGRILISETTHRLVHGHFETRPVGDLRVKGKADAVRAWEVLAARAGRTRLDIAAERGLTPFVGRARELRLLSECFEKASASQGQVVFLVGEPGIGKSRLLLEFRRQLGDGATWSEGRCLSFGRAMAFHPLVDLLSRAAGIEEADPDATLIEKLERHVLGYGEELRPALPWLRYLLSVDPGDPSVLTKTPQERRGELFDAVRRLTVRAAERSPQVVVFEDFHWIDPATEQYVVRLADGIAASRVLLIVTYRPGYTHPVGDRTYHTRIAPAPLSTEESVLIAEAILATAELPAELKGLIVEKAEGNPFYVEELVKSLREVGAVRRDDGRCVLARPLDTIALPDTIQDVITARLDRLEDGPKRLLQLAAVIGREFTHRLIDHLAEARGRTEEFLQELKALQLIYQKSLFPEPAYTFKHAVTQDVAYDSLLVRRRRELHRRIGLGIEELYADRIAEHYDVLAHHFSRAEAWDKAVDYLLKAGKKSAKAFDRGLELSGLGLEPSRRARHATGVERVAYIQNNRGDALLAKGDLSAAAEVLDEAHGLVRDKSVFDWMRWRCAVHNVVSRGELALARGDPGEAGRLADQSLEIASSTESRKYIVRAWRLKGEAALARRAWDEAARTLHEALALARTSHGPRELWKTYAALGRLYAGTKRPDEAASAYQAARETLDRVLARVRDPRLRSGMEGASLIQEICRASAPR